MNNIQPAGESSGRGVARNDLPSERLGKLQRWAWLPIPVLLLTTVIVWAENMPGAHESPWLAVSLNFVFSTLVSCFIAHLIGRSFLVQSTPGLLLLGCGMIFWGFAGVLGNAIAHNNANIGVTIHNSCVWLSALCHLAGVILSLRSDRTINEARVWLPAAYMLALGAVVLVTYSTLVGWLPTFFIQGQGGTPIRQLVLGSAIGMFGLTAVLLAAMSRRPLSPFASWYSLALGLIGVGLFAVLIQSSRGSLLGWVGRASQFLSGVYMFLAALESVRQSRVWGLSLEAALHESEERFKVLAAATFEGIALIEGCRYIDVNDQFLQMFGYRREELIGEEVAMVISPKDRDRVLRNICEGRESVTEHEAVRKDGTPISVESHGRIITYHNRQVRFAAIRDITQHKRLEASLRASEEQARHRLAEIEAIYQSAPVGLCVLDRDLRWLRLNEQIARINGAPGEAHIGKTPREVLGELGEKVEPLLRRVLETGAPLFNLEIGGATSVQPGVNRCWNNHYVPIKDPQGNVIGISIAAEEITDRKRAEETLRQSEERLQLALDAARLGTWDWRLSSVKTVWNDEHYRIFGYVPGVVPASYQSWAGRVHPDDLAPTEALLRQSIEQDGEYRAEYRILWPDGTVRWIEARGRFERDASGKAVRSYGVVAEITERKKTLEALTQAKEKLRQHAEDLERTVAERTAELRDLVNDLQHFSYSITHDMRAPLRAMQGYGQIILENGCAECLHSSNVKFLKRIIVGAERLDHLITDALNYAKVVQAELPLTPVDLGALLRGILDTYPNLQPPKVEVHLEGDIPSVMGNEAALTQCFGNLLGNAVKFVAPGVLPKVRIWSETKPDCILVWVEDNGIGIPKLWQPRIFDMFQRATKDYEGTGIGLALVRKNMERMGGKVGVESEPGQGSRFWLSFPKPD